MPEPPRQRIRAPIRTFAGAATALVLVVLVAFLALGQQAVELLEWSDQLGWAALPLFLLLYAIAVVVLLPGVLFPVAAGFFFGWAQGTVISVVGKTIGATVAFVLARYVLAGRAVPERARRVIARSSHLERLAEGLDSRSWRTVVLIRLIPLVPFKLSNYLFGWTAFELRAYLIGTILGTIPYSFTNAYLGWLGARHATATHGDPAAGISGAEAPWWVYGLVLVLTVSASIAIAQRALELLSRSPSEDRPVELGMEPDTDG